MDKKIAVIVLNYNGLQHLDYCVPSIEGAATPDAELIMVDNCSGDGGLRHFYPTRPWLTLELKQNLGWAGGNNIAIRRYGFAGVEYVLLLNNDVELHPQAFVNLCAAFEDNPQYGVLGFTVYEGGNTAAENSQYLNALSQCSDGGKALCSVEKEVGGMAMGIRVDCLKEVGLFDEVFFAYGEEVDFLARVKLTRWQIGRIMTPVWHYGGGGFRKIPRAATVLQIKANIQLALKHMSLRGIVASSARLATRFFRKSKGTDYSVESRLTPDSKINLGIAILIALAKTAPLLPLMIAARMSERNMIREESAASRSERERLEHERGSTR